ncbi:MAG: type II toxin-antitoxin system VapC family toxin [Gammaproteobacteria bacterium]|nr:MAG: type II toxin-antitoxin system VapC family toxin [Gammaproteobacteria bacterium]
MNGKSNLLLDTNIVIGFLNGHKQINNFLSNQGNNYKLNVSQITRIELLGFPNITNNEEAIIKKFLVEINVYSLSEEIENKVIELRKITRLKLPDAIIVATALIHKLKLITCDEQLIKSSDFLLSTNPCNI